MPTIRGVFTIQRGVGHEPSIRSQASLGLPDNLVLQGLWRLSRTLPHAGTDDAVMCTSSNVKFKLKWNKILIAKRMKAGETEWQDLIVLVFSEKTPKYNCGLHLSICPQHGAKEKAAINNSKHWLWTVIAALCFSPYCRHINRYGRSVICMYILYKLSLVFLVQIILYECFSGKCQICTYCKHHHLIGN